MSCMQTLTDYSLRSIGLGERRLPISEITLCEQFVLIGSGLIWNVYFAIFALTLGFMFATLLALGKASSNRLLAVPSRTFVFIFRGSPLFIQFFFAYETFVLLPKLGVDINLGFVEITAETRWLTKAWLGALVVLFFNTSAYSAEIFYGAYRSVPKGEVEAAQAYGLNGYQRFRKIIWPTLLRLAWPSYTNEAIFLFHSTAFAFLAGFPAWRQQGDALYYAKYFADKTFNPFIPYPIVGFYFICFTLLIIFLFGVVNRRLNKHLDPSDRKPLRYRPQFMR
ncbi:MAG: ABC transporter permease [Rhizobiaceae bacterium]